MIIQCPKCGFSGRIPSYALDSPHNAKCPHCKFRFELGSLAMDIEAGIAGARTVRNSPARHTAEILARRLMNSRRLPRILKQ